MTAIILDPVPEWNLRRTEGGLESKNQGFDNNGLGLPTSGKIGQKWGTLISVKIPVNGFT